MFVIKNLKNTQKEENLDFCLRWQTEHSLSLYLLSPSPSTWEENNIYSHYHPVCFPGVQSGLNATLLNKPYHL
jgi:hypothetical protein